MTPFLLGTFSAAFAAGAQIFARRFLRQVSARQYVSLNFVLIFALLLPAAPFAFRLRIDPSVIVVLLGTAALDAFGNYAYFRTFETTDAPRASALLSVSPLFTLFFAPLLTPGDLPSWQTIAGVVLVVVGLAALHVENGAHRGTIPRSAVWPLLAAAAFGISVFPARWLLASDATNPYTFYWLRAGLIALVTIPVLRPNLHWLNRSRLLWVTVRAAFVIGHWLLLLTALRSGSAVIVKTVSDASPLFVALASPTFLAERLPRRQWPALAVLVVGLALMAAGT